jgi:hypothetical protein
VPLTKSLAARQNARLPATLASLNSGHNSNLRTYCVGVRSSSRPNLVLAKPLHPRSVAWRSSLVANLSSTTPGRALAVEVDAREIAGHCRVAVTTLTCSLIWPCNNFVLSRYTRSFLVSPSLASKPMRHRLSLHFSCLGVLARVSTA